MNEIDIYFFYPKTDKKSSQSNFFESLEITDQVLKENIVFLDIQDVQQYSRFIDINHIIIKAAVPSSAIEGKTHGLTLKQGVLNKQNILGFYPMLGHSEYFVKNPFYQTISPHKN